MKRLITRPPHQPIDGLSTKTETANDMKHIISCEECYLAQERSEKELLCMCYGMDRSGVHVDIESIEVHTKCPLLTLKKKIIPEKRIWYQN